MNEVNRDVTFRKCRQKLRISRPINHNVDRLDVPVLLFGVGIDVVRQKQIMKSRPKDHSFVLQMLKIRRTVLDRTLRPV